jgi:hypothetical protein
MRFLLSLFLGSWVSMVASAADLGPRPLLAAHAHNDYEHPRPLFDALACGFASIEADIHLVDGRLLVAHDRKSVKPERTLEALYLDPLRARVRENGGRVYRDGPTITLLIDVKSEAVATYTVLRETLRAYAEMLTVYRNGVASPGAVNVIISGNRARAELAAEPVRYAALDGRIEDLAANPPAELVPWISDNWRKVSAWNWTGPIPDAERRKIRDLVAQAHAQGRRLRFWATPDKPEVWQVLRAEGVDLIGTDHLAGLRDFLLAPPVVPGR